MKNRTAPKKFQHKLLISYLLMIIIPFVISGFLLSYFTAKNIRRNTMEYIGLFNEQVSSNIDSYIRSLDRLSKTVFLDTSVTEALRTHYSNDPVGNYQVSRYLTDFTFQLNVQQPDLQNVILLNQHGEPFISGSSSTFLDEELFYQAILFDEANEAAGRIVISGAGMEDYLYTPAVSPVFSVSRVIKDEASQQVGLIVMNVRSEALERSININQALLDRGARIVVTNSQNQIVMQSTQSAVGSFDYRKYLDNSKYTFFSSTSDYSELSVYTIIPTETLFSEIYSLRSINLVITLALMAVIIIVAAFLSSNLVKPVKRLERTMSKVQDGKLCVHSHIKSRDEIGSLANSYNLMIDRINDLVQNVYYAELKNKEAHLQALQQQIDPHFLHNTLESIRMKAVGNNDRETAKMIQKLGTLFRFALDSTESTALLSREVSHAKAYIDIMNMRYDGRFTLNFDVPEGLWNCRVIKLLFQPIVENSIRHGFTNSIKLGKICINASQNGDIISIKISDDGVGIPLESLQVLNKQLKNPPVWEGGQTAHIGLVNISQRLMLRYGSAYHLSVDSMETQGTTVCICLPYRQVTDEN